MKKFKAAIPTVCYTVLLLAIALLSFLIAGKTELTTTSAHTPTTDKTSPSTKSTVPAETIYDDVFPRSSVNGKQKIYGDGNVALSAAFQTPAGNYVVLSSDCKKGDISSNGPVNAVVKLNRDNDLISAYQLTSAETFVAVQQTPEYMVLVTSDGEKYASVHIIGYDLLGETKYMIPAPRSVRIVPTEKDFILFATYADECVAYTLANGTLLSQSLGKYTLVDLFEYEDTYALFCNDLSGGSSVLIADKKTLTVAEKQHVSGDSLLFIKPTSIGILTIEQGEKTCARVYSVNMKERLKEKDLGATDVKTIFRTDTGTVLSYENSVVLLCDDLTTELVETPDRVLLDVVNINGSDRLLYKDTTGNIFFDDLPPFTQAEKAVVLPTLKNSVTVVAEKKDKYSFIEIADLPY